MMGGCSRRAFLAGGLVAGSTGVTGCAELIEDRDEELRTITPDDAETPTESPESDTGNELNIGAVYIPVMGGPPEPSKWPDCAVGEPDIGRYSHDEDDFEEKGRAATNTHIEQMAANGISRVMFNFGEEKEDYARLRNFKDVERSGETDLECYYVISQALRRERDIEQDFEFIRDQFLEDDNYSTYDDRPVIQFWDMGYLSWGGNEDSKRVKDHIEEEWGFGDFVEYLREELTVDGRDPFLVADFMDFGRVYQQDAAGDDTLEMVRRFDAVSTWTGDNPHDETISWEEALAFVETNFEGYQNVVEDYDVEFVPTVFPGFDDRENECWGENRHLPRDTDGFRALLELADEYRTTELVNIATWNDWNEGHQIEPGSHMGEEYGTDYLEVVSEFANRD